MRRKLLTLFFILSFVMYSNATLNNDTLKINNTNITINTNNIECVILDYNTNEKLSGASIKSNSKTIYSDLDGKFTIKNKDELYNIYLISYKLKEIIIKDNKLRIIMIRI